MAEQPNGAVAPEGSGALSDAAIDQALDATEHQPTEEEARALKAEKEAQDLRDHLRALQDANQQLTTRSKKQDEILGELLDRTKAVDDRSREAQDRGWQYARDDLEARIERAAAEADTATVRVLMAEMKALDQAKPSAKPEPKTKKTEEQPTQAADPIVSAWFNANPWYNTDSEMRGYADGAYNNLLATEPNTATADKLAKVKAKVIRKFPENFPNEARNNPPAVSRPGPQGGTRAKPKEKTEADLPPEAREVMERLVRRKVLTKDQYLKDFQW